jgi:hypothetical protein
MQKLKVPWHTCSRVLEAFKDIIEPEERPEYNLDLLRKINQPDKGADSVETKNG